jgi:MFS family permease
MPRRHIILALLVALSVITFLDRLCISVAGPRMQAELGIPPERWGIVLSSFVLAYGLFEIPTGMMGDRSGQRGVLTRIVLWWSAFTAITGSVSGFLPLVITRFLFGAGEAGAYPNMSGVVRRWFPVHERARAQGYIWGASRFGGALAPLLVVPLQQAYGWRASFWVFGLIGCIWCAAWWFYYRDEGAPFPPEAHTAPAAHMFRSRQLWLILGMYGSYAWGSWFFFSWLHTFLIKARGFSESEMAIAASMPFLLGTASNIAGGYVSDAACRRWGLRSGRRRVGVTSLTVSAIALLGAAASTDRIATIILLTLSFGIMDLMLPSAWAICLDIGGSHSGAVTGAMNTAGQLGGFVCTLVFGYAVKYFNSYDAPLVLIAGMLFLAAFLFSRIDATQPLFPQSKGHL